MKSRAPQSNRRRMRHPAAGLTLLELLVSLTLSTVVVGALYGALVAFNKIQIDQTLRTEVEQSLRASFELMSRDLQSAGYELIGNGQGGDLGTVYPNIDATSDTVVTNQLTIWSLPDTNGDGNLTVDSTASTLIVDDATNFATGDKVWVIGTCSDSTTNRSLVELTGVAATTLSHSSSLVCTFATDAKVAELVSVSYRVNGTSLQRKEDAGAWTTIMDGVSGLTVTYYDSTAATVTPDTAAKRNSVVRMKFEMTGKTVEGLRGSGISDTVTFTSEVAPRNFLG